MKKENNIKKGFASEPQTTTNLHLNNNTEDENKTVVNGKTETKKKTDKKKSSSTYVEIPHEEESGRIFSIVQYLNNPDTGKPLYSEKNVTESIEKNLDCIKDWAWIEHNLDIVTLHDIAENPTAALQPGDRKPPHIHIAIRTKSNVKVKDVAKMFGVNNWNVQLTGKNQKILKSQRFAAIFGYLIHFNNPEKHTYESTAVKANFDYIEFIHGLNLIKDNNKLTSIEYQLLQVFRYGKKLLNVRYEIGEEKYAKFRNAFDKNRQDYLKNYATKPDKRFNVYIEGPGGVGKTLFARELAEKMVELNYPNLRNSSTEEKVFEIKSKGVLFIGYDGQPALVFNDMRSDEMRDSMDSKNNIFNLLDTFPNSTDNVQNVKFGHAYVVNSINVVNSVEEYRSFLDGIVNNDTEVNRTGKIEDKSQIYRRFPFIIILEKDRYTLLINKYYLNESTDPYEFYVIGPIKCHLAQLYRDAAGDKKLIKKHSDKIMQPILDEYQKILKKQIDNKKTELELEKLYANEGELIVEESAGHEE